MGSSSRRCSPGLCPTLPQPAASCRSLATANLALAVRHCRSGSWSPERSSHAKLNPVRQGARGVMFVCTRTTGLQLLQSPMSSNALSTTPFWVRRLTGTTVDAQIPTEAQSRFGPRRGCRGRIARWGWWLTAVTPASDVNQQVLQDQELAFVTAFAGNGDPNATGTPERPRLNYSGEVMSLRPAATASW